MFHPFYDAVSYTHLDVYKRQIAYYKIRFSTSLKDDKLIQYYSVLAGWEMFGGRVEPLTIHAQI